VTAGLGTAGEGAAAGAGDAVVDDVEPPAALGGSVGGFFVCC